MKKINDILSNNPVESMSNKVQSLMENENSKNSLVLPKNSYQSFLLKIMNDFKSHHNIEDTIPPPSGRVTIDVVFSYIASLMALSMGKEKYDAIIKECEEYKKSLPTDFI